MYLQRQRKNLGLCLSLWFGPFNIMGLCVNGVSQISLFLVLNRIRDGSLVANWLAALRRVCSTKCKAEKHGKWQRAAIAKVWCCYSCMKWNSLGSPLPSGSVLWEQYSSTLQKHDISFKTSVVWNSTWKFPSNWLNVLCYLLLKYSSNFRRKDRHFCKYIFSKLKTEESNLALSKSNNIEHFRMYFFKLI